jgi:hypothetical protein
MTKPGELAIERSFYGMVNPRETNQPLNQNC